MLLFILLPIFLYFSVVSMGICSLIITIVLYITETIYFRAATFNFYVVFPCILNGKIRNLPNEININHIILTAVTLAGLMYLPKHLKLWDPLIEMDEETNQLLKQASAMKRRRNARKNN